MLTCIYNELSLLCRVMTSNQGWLPGAGSGQPGGWGHPRLRFFRQVGGLGRKDGEGTCETVTERED